jgi:hypothetical protein
MYLFSGLLLVKFSPVWDPAGSGRDVPARRFNSQQFWHNPHGKKNIETLITVLLVKHCRAVLKYCVK